MPSVWELEIGSWELGVVQCYSYRSAMMGFTAHTITKVGLRGWR